MKNFTTTTLAIILTLTCGCASRQTFVVAHRGNSSVAPENTLAAFRAAWDNNVEYIELDVYQTADNVIICNHDNSLKRVSLGASQKLIKEMTFEEIKQYDVGSWKDPKFTGEKVPTLEEVFAELPSDGKIFLELKSINSDFPLLLLDLMKKYNISKNQITIISFKGEYIQNLNKLAPNFKSNWLLDIKNSKDNPNIPIISAKDLIEELTKIGATGIGAKVGSAVDKKYIETIKNAGFEFHVWTIDNPETAIKLQGMGVDSITTNKPVFIKEKLQNSNL